MCGTEGLPGVRPLTRSDYLPAWDIPSPGPDAEMIIGCIADGAGPGLVYVVQDS